MKTLEKRIPKILAWLDYELIQLGESMTEIVENVWCLAGIDVCLSGLNSASLSKSLEKAYELLLKTHPECIHMMLTERFIVQGCGEDLISNLRSEFDATDVSETTMYKNIADLTTYAKRNNWEILSPLYDLLCATKERDIRVLCNAWAAGNHYYKYLPAEVFGICSNDSYTAGYVLTDTDYVEESIDRRYEYVCRKDIPGTGLAIVMLFRNENDTDMAVDFLLERRGYLNEAGSCVGKIAFMKEMGSMKFTKLQNAEELTKEELFSIWKEYAKRCTEYAKEALSLCESVPSLKNYLPFNSPVENL